MRIGEDKSLSDCERCSNYVFDDEYEDYSCEAPIDQDVWEKMQYDPTKRCPYFIEDGEYRTVKKQN